MALYRPRSRSNLAQVIAVLGATAHDVNVLVTQQWAATGADCRISVRVSGEPPLSPAEARVLTFIPSFMTGPEIARHLQISHHTVKSHLGKIYRKLGVSSRAEAVERLRISGQLQNASHPSWTDAETVTRLQTAVGPSPA